MELEWRTYTKRKVNVKALRFYPTSLAVCEAIAASAAGSMTPMSIQTNACYDDSLPGIAGNTYELDVPRLFIETLEGSMEVMPGDYIVIGTNGEYYPCKTKPFEQVHMLPDASWKVHQLTKDNLVDVADWINGTDVSTIQGMAAAYLYGRYESLGYLEVTDTRTGKLYQAAMGDYILQDPEGCFHVVTESVYRFMNA